MAKRCSASCHFWHFLRKVGSSRTISQYLPVRWKITNDKMEKYGTNAKKKHNIDD